jgi:hypothetical protein
MEKPAIRQRRTRHKARFQRDFVSKSTSAVFQKLGYHYAFPIVAFSRIGKLLLALGSRIL